MSPCQGNSICYPKLAKALQSKYYLEVQFSLTNSANKINLSKSALAPTILFFNSFLLPEKIRAFYNVPSPGPTHWKNKTDNNTVA